MVAISAWHNELEVMPTSHKHAVAGSVAIHVAVVAIALFSVSHISVDIPPQQAVYVTLVAGMPVPQQPAEKQMLPASKPQPAPKPQPAAIPKAAPDAEALPQEKKQPAQTDHTNEAEKLSDINPAAGTPPATSGQTGQAVVSTPIFEAAYLRNPAPPYPDQAKRRRIQGTVMLKVVVTADGTARHVEIVTSSGYPMLDDSARSTVARWKFIPAKKGGEPVEAPVIVPIEFRMAR